MLKFNHENYEYIFCAESQHFQILRNDSKGKLIDFIRFVGGYDYGIEIYDAVPRYWFSNPIEKSFYISKSSPIYHILKTLVGLSIACDYPDSEAPRLPKEISIEETEAGINFNLYSESIEEDFECRSIISLKNICHDLRSTADLENPEIKDRLREFFQELTEFTNECEKEKRK